jgi:hypothetical protein
MSFKKEIENKEVCIVWLKPKNGAIRDTMLLIYI